MACWGVCKQTVFTQDPFQLARHELWSLERGVRTLHLQIIPTDLANTTSCSTTQLGQTQLKYMSIRDHTREKIPGVVPSFGYEMMDFIWNKRSHGQNERSFVLSDVVSLNRLCFLQWKRNRIVFVYLEDVTFFESWMLFTKMIHRCGRILDTYVGVLVGWIFERKPSGMFIVWFITGVNVLFSQLDNLKTTIS